MSLPSSQVATDEKKEALDREFGIGFLLQTSNMPTK
jgi:hypothetical protein